MLAGASGGRGAESAEVRATYRRFMVRSQRVTEESGIERRRRRRRNFVVIVMRLMHARQTTKPPAKPPPDIID